MRNFLALTCAAAVSLAGAASARDAWLNGNDFARVELLVADTASPSEMLGAKVFTDYWERLTSVRPGRSVTPTPGAVHVWIGRDGVPEQLLSMVDLEGLGRDGFVIKTILPNPAVGIEDRHMLIIGGRENGTMYGVYEFFKRAMGVRWLAPEVVHVPEGVARVAMIDHRFVPRFIFRDSTYWWHWPNRDEYLRAHRVSTYPGYGSFGHSMYEFLPPEKFFPTNPEYYSLVDGERVAPWNYPWHDHEEAAKHPGTLGQLCSSNPEVAEHMIEEIKRRIAANPAPKIWSVSQMDWAGHCECDACAEIDEREGTPMGSVLTLVNRIAEGIEEEYPDHVIDTFAYQHTRRPPKHLKPRHNVYIRLCSLECDFSTPLNDPKSPVNRAFAEDIRDWAKITDNLWIWDYTPTYTSYHAPHPNFHVLQPNAAFFAEHNVVGLFEQGAEYPGAEFAHLRAYMIAELMWDPFQDGEALKNEFVELYYQEAAPHILEYIALVTEKARDESVFMGCFDAAFWMDRETIVKAEAVFDRAFAVAETEEVRARVQEAYLPVQWSALVYSPTPEIEGNVLTLRRMPSITLQEYQTKAKALGMLHPETHEYTERRVGKHFASQVVTAEISVIENDRYLVWTVPALSGAIIRWRDKQNNVELLDSYKRPWAMPGKWEDWVSTPGVLEGPVADEYEVVRHDPATLVLRAVADSGLVVEREMRLEEGGLRMTLKASNPTEDSLETTAKLHPEFSTQGQNLPEIFLRKTDGLWESRNDRLLPHSTAYGALIRAQGYNEMAYFVSEKNVGVRCVFDREEVAFLLYFFNYAPDHEHANLELILDSAELAPGESRQLGGFYEVITARPDSGNL